MDNLNELAKAYYNGNPIVSDEEYDSLEGATEKIGYESDDNTIPHITFMSSQDKSKDFQRANNFKRIMVEYKYDGLSVELVYYPDPLGGYSFRMATSRGDGYRGKDITNNVGELIPTEALNIPKQYTNHLNNALLGVYCEAVVNKSRIYQNGIIQGNLRNIASGAVMAIERRDTLDLVDLIPFEVSDLIYSKENDLLLGYLKKAFQKNDKFRVSYTESIGNLKAIYNSFTSMKDVFPYPTDGIIVKEAIRENRKHIKGKNPVWSFAVKWPDSRHDTTITNIRFNVGRTGRVVPIAELDPFTTDSGAIITYVTLNNISWMKERNLGIGSMVVLVRSGDVIPKIEEVLTSGSEVSINTCPRCYEQLIEDGKDLMCTNENCIGRLENRLINFFGHYGLKILGIAEKTVEKYVRKYSFTDQVNMVTIIKDMLMDNKHLINYVENNSVQIDDFITAIGIEGIGKNTVNNYADFINSSKTPIEALKNLIIILSKSNPVRSLSALKFLRHHEQEFIELAKIFKVRSNVLDDERQILKGYNVVFTGTLSNTREEMEREARTYGARILSSVTKQVSFVVVGNNPGRIKQEQAEKYHIPILSELEYYALIAEKSNNLGAQQ